MGELNLLWEQYHQLFCMEYRVKDELCFSELETIKEEIEHALKEYVVGEWNAVQQSVIDYVDIRNRANGEVLTVSVQVSEICEDKIELFIIGRNTISQQIFCTFFLQVFIQIDSNRFRHIPRNDFLQQDFEHREYKRRVRKKLALLFER